MTRTWTEEIRQQLLAPFSEEEVDYLPRGGGSSGKAIALAYIDARAVMTRLDTVVGPENWAFHYEMLTLDAKRVKGILAVLGVTKMDAGEASGEEEPLKSAVSDAVKRAGVQFGIGRYLYSLPDLWAPYDPQKRRFTERPKHAPAHIAHALRVVGYTGAGPAPSAPQQRPAPAQAAKPNGGAQEPAKGGSWIAARDAFRSAYAAAGHPTARESVMAVCQELLGDKEPKRELGEYTEQQLVTLTMRLSGTPDPFAEKPAPKLPIETPPAFR